jgi:Spy/CpxP family protein refolding chaperone
MMYFYVEPIKFELKMKKYGILALVAFLMMSLSISAQDSTGRRGNRNQPPRTMRMTAKERAEHMANVLELTSEQKEQVEELLKKHDEKRAEQMAKFREDRQQAQQQDREKRREEMRALMEQNMEEQDAELEKIIGKEKMEQWKIYRQEQMKKRGSRGNAPSPRRR